jgi:diguanylate cyclase (GGDEF)-like protein
LRVKFSRALFLSISLILLVLLSVGAMLAREIIAETVNQNARQNVIKTVEYFRQQLGVRAGELAGAVTVLVEDFGFQDAVASNDYDTIVSALENQVARIGADHAVVRLTDGRSIASGGNTPASMTPQTSDKLETDIVVQAIDGAAHLVISTPVGNHIPVGRIALSFKMGEQFLAQMKSLVGADVTFLVRSAATDDVLMSTVLLPTSTSSLNSYQASLLSLSEQRPEIIYLNDVALMSAPLIMTGSDGVQVFVHTAMSTEADPFRTLSVRLGILVTGAFVLVLFLSSWLSRRVTRPLRDLGGLAKRIAGGDYQVKFPKQSFTEFSQLGEAFDNMQGAISDREKNIHDQARSDVLTKLSNRLAAVERVSALLKEKHTRPFALIAVDIYRLREINDSLGSDTGDEVLCWLARNLQSLAQRDATVCRLASDDFLLILPRANETDALALARKLLSSIREPIQLSGDVKALIKLHVGISLAPDHGQEADILIQRAEQSMYRAREQGEVQVYDSAVDARRRRRIDLTRDLRDAISSNQLSLLFQPKIDFSKPEEVLVEVFPHWEHPVYGEVAPEEFIPLAESSGLMSEVNAWLLEQSCSVHGEWFSKRAVVPMSMNIFAQDLDDPSFVTRLIDTTRRHGLHKSLLCLQITESLASDSLTAAKEVIGRLRRQQVKVSISQFGAGKSSLALLRELEVDEISIDSSFVEGLLRGKVDKAITESIVALGHRLGVRVFADGVESRDMLKILRGMEVDGIQGQCLSRPLSKLQFEAWREAWLSGKRRSGQ